MYIKTGAKKFMDSLFYIWNTCRLVTYRIFQIYSDL